MEIYDQKLGIKLWAEEDRPREKMLQNGKRHLTDAELIAILISSGNRSETAVDLSKRVLSFYDHNLSRLSKATVSELSKFKGIGKVKALSIVAALELGVRRKDHTEVEMPCVSCSKDVYDYLYSDFAHLNHEEFWILILSRSNHILSKHLISKGGQSGTVADPKIIFKTALENNACSIVLAHNHPSGSLKPSAEDVKLTKNAMASGDLLGIVVADHLIFTDHGYYSLKDNRVV